MFLPGHITLGIFAVRLERPRCGTNPFADITNGGAHDIAWGQHQAQFVVVAKQRRQPLVVDQRHRTQRHHAGTTHQQLAKQFALPAAVGDLRLAHQHRRQHPQQQDVSGKLERHQVAHFRHIGFGHVAEHARINKYAVLVHEVSHAGATDEQDHK